MTSPSRTAANDHSVFSSCQKRDAEKETGFRVRHGSVTNGGFAIGNGEGIHVPHRSLGKFLSALAEQVDAYRHVESSAFRGQMAHEFLLYLLV